ncbi:hypothetical protein [Leuconostoc citreum]
MKEVNTKIIDLQTYKKYKQPIKPIKIINILFQIYRKIFFPMPQVIIFIFSVCLLIWLLENLMSQKISILNFKVVSFFIILIILISVQLYILDKTINWKKKMWFKSQKKLLKILNVKNEMQCFSLIKILENYEQEYARNKRLTNKFWKAIATNIFITTINGLFIITSAIIQKFNIFSNLKIYYPIINNVILFIFTIILFSIYVCIMLKDVKNELNIFSKKGRIEIVINQLYVFNYQVMQANNFQKNIKKSKTK